MEILKGIFVKSGVDLTIYVVETKELIFHEYLVGLAEEK